MSTLCATRVTLIFYWRQFLPYTDNHGQPGCNPQRNPIPHFHYLETQDRWECSTVCRSWQSRILNWQGMWTSLTQTDWYHILYQPEKYSTFISGSSVKRVSLGPDVHLLPQQIDFLSSKCNAVKEVELVAPDFRVPILSRLASLFGTTLSYISVSLYTTMERGQPVENKGPDALLRHFPNLSKLVYTGPLPSEWTQNLEGVRHEHLTNLTMDIPNCYGDLNSEALFQAAPKLQYLTMSLSDISEDNHFASKLHRHCPELISLFLTSSTLEDMETLGTTHMKSLAIEDGACAYPVALDILRNSTNGIQSLALSGAHLVDTLLDLSTNAFPSLTHVTISEPTNTNRLSLFLEHSVPNLEYFEYLGDSDSYDTILSSLRRHSSCLQEIRLGSRNVTEQALVGFIQAMTSLQKVHFIHDTPALTSKGLHMIANSAIRELYVNANDPLGTSTINSIEVFLEHVASAGKVFDKLKFTIRDFTDTIIFLSDDKIKVLLEKLDSAAKDWQLSIFLGIVTTHQVKSHLFSVAHPEYRKQRVKAEIISQQMARIFGMYPRKQV